MDLDNFRVLLSRSKADVWAVIETAITVAGADHPDELKERRDKIVELIYASSGQTCRNCIKEDIADDRKINGLKVVPNNLYNKSPLTPESNQLNFDNDNETKFKADKTEDGDGEDELDPYGGLFDDEQTEILRIKERLEDPDQDDESVIEFLQTLADMDITFQALKETDIGRHVNKFRKHPSADVRKLVKQLVRKWKETVDEWVRLNEPEKASANLIADADSPQHEKYVPKPHNQVPDFGYSPNPQNGGSSSDKYHLTPEHKAKAVAAPPQRQLQSSSANRPISAPPQNRPKTTNIDMERLASARKRLHENYQEAQNAKKQRTIQQLDIHEIPKPKNGFIAKNKGGFQGRHHR